LTKTSSRRIDAYMADKLEGDNLRKISINFPADLWKLLKFRALQEDKNVTEILVQLSREYLARGKRKGRR